MRIRLWATAMILVTLTVFFTQLIFSAQDEKKAGLHTIGDLRGDQLARQKTSLQEEPANLAAEVLSALPERDHTAGEFGVHVDGVYNQFDTDEKEIALTFDLCGGVHGSDFDEEMVEFLRDEEIPAVLFVNKRWIKENENQFIKLYEDPLFTIENHGTEHKPLSVDGNKAWGIAGTSSAEEAVTEVMTNQQAIYERTGENPELFRAGTAHVDEKSVTLVERLDMSVVNYDILGDAGATYSASEVKESLMNAEAGSIALLHMNQPKSGTAEGVRKAVPELRADGYEFVDLENKVLIE